MYLSFGGSCEVIEQLNKNGPTHFFDYLWNQYDGLKSVSNIIQNNFKYMDDIKNYTVSTTHPVLNATNVKEVVNVNVYYPNVVFLHYDTSCPRVIESLNRKIKRTQEFLSDTRYKVFIYDRTYQDDGGTKRDLIDETIEFCNVYTRMYNTNFCILALARVPEDTCITDEDVSRLQVHNTEHMKFDYVKQSTWSKIFTKYSIQV